MAGSPIAILAPFLKKYGAELFVVAGVLAYWKRRSSFDYTYRFVYSKNDFERKKTLEDINNFVERH